MSYRLMFMINAIVAAVFGAVLLVMPKFILDQLGTEPYVATQLVIRFLGGALFVSGALLWYLKDVPAKVQKEVSFALLAGSVGGFALSIMGMTSIGVFRSNGWVLLVIYGVLSLIYGYLLFLQPKQTKIKGSRTAQGKRSAFD